MNGVQPLERALDGFLLVVTFGRFARFETPPNEDGDLEASIDGKARVRNDLKIPVMMLTTETAAEDLYPFRQPDTKRFRTWEIAGAAHASITGGIPQDIVAALGRDEFQIGGGGGTADQDAEPAAPAEPVELNRIHWLLVFQAARRDVASWAAGGKAPPAFALIKFTRKPLGIARDEHGNARGGIRMPELEVPIASYTGRQEVEGPFVLFGTTERFSPEKVQDLYPSLDAYLAAFGEAVDRAVKAGFILEEDAAATKSREAEYAAELFVAP